MALTPKQLAERTRRIGGSDAAAIVGKDPYRTAWEVAMRIRGEMEADKSLEDADQILFGNEMEGVLARIYERKNKVKLVEPDTMVHEKHPFLAVNIDRRIEGNPALALEMKNTGQKFQAAGTPILESWGSPGTDQVPERVILQCQHAMMIDPLIQMFHVVRCYGGNVYQQFVVPRNASLIDALQEIELEFYKRAMEGLLPEPDIALPGHCVLKSARRSLAVWPTACRLARHRRLRNWVAARVVAFWRLVHPLSSTSFRAFLNVEPTLNDFFPWHDLYTSADLASFRPGTDNESPLDPQVGHALAQSRQRTRIRGGTNFDFKRQHLPPAGNEEIDLTAGLRAPVMYTGPDEALHGPGDDLLDHKPFE